MRNGTKHAEQSDTELVVAARSGKPEAFGELFDRWFDRSWNVARNIVRNDETAAEVSQDAMLAAWQGLDKLADPDAFGGWLLRITRNRALNRLQREQRSKPEDDEIVSGLRDRGLHNPGGAEREPEPDAIVAGRDQQDLVWAAAQALGERDASLLDLHLRHGLTPAEIATELGVAPNNAHQQLFRLRNKLGDAIGSYLLWRNGRPLCDGLAAAVSPRTAFDRSLASVVSRHQKDCGHCAERRAALVDPHKLFAAVPLLVAPSHLKLYVASALAASGVPTNADPISNPTNFTPKDPPPSVTGQYEPVVNRSTRTNQPSEDVAVKVTTGGANSSSKVLPLLATTATSVVVVLAALFFVTGNNDEGDPLAAIGLGDGVNIELPINGQGSEADLPVDAIPEAISAEPIPNGQTGPTLGDLEGVAGDPNGSSPDPSDVAIPSSPDDDQPDREDPELIDPEPTELEPNDPETEQPPIGPQVEVPNPEDDSEQIPAGPQTVTPETGGTEPPLGSSTETSIDDNPGDPKPPDDDTGNGGNDSGRDPDDDDSRPSGGGSNDPDPGDDGTDDPGPEDNEEEEEEEERIVAAIQTAVPPRVASLTGRAISTMVCPDPSLNGYEAAWTIDNATTAKLTTPTGAFRVSPSGSQQFCAASGQSVTVTGTGIGGTGSASIRLP